MNPQPRLYGLEKFGLTPSTLSRLGTRPVRFSVQLVGRRLPGLVRFAPRRRDAILRAALAAQTKRLATRFPDARLRSRGKRKASWTLDGILPAGRVRVLAHRPEVHHVTVDSIDGRQPMRRSARRTKRWFCVWGIVVIQVEGRMRGSVDVEDRFVLVKAYDANDARDRLGREWRNYATPYLNPDGYMVRWRLASVRDIHEIWEDPLDPRGTEVYSRLRTVRMKPEYRWLPRRTGG